MLASPVSIAPARPSRTQPSDEPKSRDVASSSEAEWIEAALQGNQDAYALLVRRYQPRLVAAIRANVQCPELAEDIVQDAFVRAFAKLDSFRGESSFYTWLYRIARNARRDHLRHRHRWTSFDMAAEEWGSQWAAPQPSPLEALEGNEECEQVRAAMARLDDHHRRILMLREFEGFDYQAISEAMQLTLGTVRSRLNRARAQLRKELACYWKSAPTEPPTPRPGSIWPHSNLSLTA